MKDITDEFLKYLEATRHLWNSYFKEQFISLFECSPLEEYECIDKLLFSALVWRILNLPNGKSRQVAIEKPWDIFRVQPRMGATSLPMMVSDSVVDNITGNRRWEDTKLFDLKHESNFGFIEFFEWNRYGFVTYPYIRVKIDEHSHLPHLSGKEALIEIINVRIFHKPAIGSG